MRFGITGYRFRHHLIITYEVCRAVTRYQDKE